MSKIHSNCREDKLYKHPKISVFFYPFFLTHLIFVKIFYLTPSKTNNLGGREAVSYLHIILRSIKTLPTLNYECIHYKQNKTQIPKNSLLQNKGYKSK